MNAAIGKNDVLAFIDAHETTVDDRARQIFAKDVHLNLGPAIDKVLSLAGGDLEAAGFQLTELDSIDQIFDETAYNDARGEDPDPEEYTREVVERWAVSSMLGGRLRAVGEVVVSWLGYNVWMRTTGG